MPPRHTHRRVQEKKRERGKGTERETAGYALALMHLKKHEKVNAQLTQTHMTSKEPAVDSSGIRRIYMWTRVLSRLAVHVNAWKS